MRRGVRALAPDGGELDHQGSEGGVDQVKIETVKPGIRRRTWIGRDGRKRVMYDARYWAKGTERWRSFRTLDEAERWRRAQQVALDKNEWTDPAGARTPFSVVAADWAAGRLDVRPSTRTRDEAYLRSLIAPTFGRRTLKEITRPGVRAWIRDLDDRGYAAATIRKGYQLLASILDFAVAGGLIPKSPASKVALPRIKRVERRFLSVEEVERLAAATGRYATYVRTLAYCVPRPGEARAVRVGDLDLFRRRMSITRTMVELNGGRISFNEPKTSASVRTIGIPESLVGPLAALCEGLGRDDLVFTSPRGEPIRARNFRSRTWLPATEAAGLAGLTVHELRHTCVALLIGQGVGPKQIQAQLGHEDVRTTLGVYGHLFEGHEDVTAAAMDAAIAAAPGWDRDEVVVPLAAVRSS
jgi:integrase